MTSAETHSPPPVSKAGWKRRAAGAAIVLAILGIGLAWWSYVRRGHPTVAAGYAALERGDLQTAARIADRCLAIAPDARAWQLRAACCEESEDFSGAADALLQALQLEPDRQALRKPAGLALLRASRWSEAEQQLRLVLAVTPDDASVRTEFQWLLFNELREREVEMFLLDSLIRHPEKFEPLFHLAMVRARPPVPQESLGPLQRVNENHPGQPAIELALARCALKSGDVSQAANLLEAARSGLVNNLEFRLTAAEVALGRGDAQRVHLELTPPADTDWSDDDRWWFVKGQAFELEENWSEAARCLEQAVNLRPGDVKSTSMRATLLRTLGKTAESEVLHTRAQLLAQAEREIFVFVSRSALHQPTRATCDAMARHTATLARPVEAAGWKYRATQAK